jgi:hypothetical protein
MEGVPGSFLSEQINANNRAMMNNPSYAHFSPGGAGP